MIREIPSPILYNPWKHHWSFVRHQLRLAQSGEIKWANWIRSLRTRLGQSQMDMYTGEVSPFELGTQIISILNDQGRLAEEPYRKWLQENKSGYQTIKSIAGSDWVFRWGEEPHYFVHIHPGRYAPQTFRIKANTLKTALALLVYRELHPGSEIDTELINLLRTKELELSPIRDFTAANGLQEVLRRLDT